MWDGETNCFAIVLVWTDCTIPYKTYIWKFAFHSLVKTVNGKSSEFYYLDWQFYLFTCSPNIFVINFISLDQNKSNFISLDQNKSHTLAWWNKSRDWPLHFTKNTKHAIVSKVSVVNSTPNISYLLGRSNLAVRERDRIDLTKDRGRISKNSDTQSHLAGNVLYSSLGIILLCLTVVQDNAQSQPCIRWV